MTHERLTTGVFPAMVTPFTESGDIDHDALAAEASRLAAAGVDGLVPVGSTGESATLSHEEHVEVVETVVEAVDDVPVIAGSGSNNTREAIDLSAGAEAAGADGLLLISPYYNRPEPPGMEAHYRAVADAVDLPQILYNVPSRTGRSMAVETTAALAKHPNVVGYKAASGDLGLISEVVEHTRGEDFAVISGDDGLTLPIMSVGGTGTISVAANVDPDRVIAIVKAAAAGDFEAARTIHHELGPLLRALFVESNPIPVKEALAIQGRCRPTVRSPLSRLSGDRRSALADVMGDLDLEQPP